MEIIRFDFQTFVLNLRSLKGGIVGNYDYYQCKRRRIFR